MGFFSRGFNALVSTVKKAFVQTVGWMANEAQAFVGDVKRLYQAAKPYISKARIAVRVIAEYGPIPWMKAAATLVDKVLGGLENLENHPLAQKVNDAIAWIIERAKAWHRDLLDEQEAAQARQRAQDLEEAMAKASQADRGVLEGLAMVNRYELLRVQINHLIHNESFVDFEHYLRVRAVQKLLPVYQRQMDAVKDITDVLEEPLFIIKTAAVLVEAHAELDDFSMRQLDRLTTSYFGKPVIPFVFEEMIAVWGLDLQQSQQRRDQLGQQVARDRAIRKRLLNEAQFGQLSIEEQKVLDDLISFEKPDKARLDLLDAEILAQRNYVFAAEGFLQLLENDEQRLIDQDREYLIDDGVQVGEILIRCAQQGEKWENLSDQEQSLIISFANIFEADCHKRSTELMQVEVAA